MKITMVMIMSLNGKTTRGNEPNVRTWASVEDQTYFTGLIQKSRLIVMGRETYDVAKGYMRLSRDRLRIVMTRTPEAHESEAIAGELEFSADSPTDLVRKMEKRGYEELLLLGGSVTNALFLRSGLVHEIHLTVEPTLFGVGKPLVQGPLPNIPLKLVTTKQLNERGTLLLIYTVSHP